MAKNRRRQYYIDRLFQRRFILLFLLAAALIVVGNVVFYLGQLRPMVDDLMYRSHIVLDNPAQLIRDRLFALTGGLIAAILLLSVTFYSIMRVRLHRYLGWFSAAIGDAIAGRWNRSWTYTGEEFQDASPVLEAFFQQLSDQQTGRALYLKGLCRALAEGHQVELDRLLRMKQQEEEK